AARSLGHAGELLEQPAQVVRIARPLACIARREHPGSSAERVDLDAGVVGERRQGCRARRVPGLEERVLEERGAGLLRGADAELALGDQLEVQRREQRGELAQLARVATREDDAAHGALSAWAWSVNSVAMPSAARLRSASSSWRRKACPSAVPWISTNAPPLFMPTFMSVSAWESSS